MSSQVNLEFTVHGCAVSQPRQRHTPLMRDGAPVIGRGGRPIVINYTPTKSPANQWKSDVKHEAWIAISKASIQYNRSGPLRIDIDVYFPRPQKFMRVKDPDGPLYHIAKPDRDNIDKGILDALKGVVFNDDSQVCQGEIRKYYHEKNGMPRTEIRITALAG